MNLYKVRVRNTESGMHTYITKYVLAENMTEGVEKTKKLFPGNLVAIMLKQKDIS